MGKRFIVLLSAILFMAPLTNLTAQQAYTLMSFDVGYGMAFNMGANSDIRTLQNFGINFRVVDPLTIGMAYKTVGTERIGMLKMKYDIIPLVRGMVGFGSTITGAPTMTTGLGFEIVPFRRQVGGLFTEFKLVPEYVFRPAVTGNMAGGDLMFGLVLGIGF
jgi:hypothetical protein